ESRSDSMRISRMLWLAAMPLVFGPGCRREGPSQAASVVAGAPALAPVTPAGVLATAPPHAAPAEPASAPRPVAAPEPARPPDVPKPPGLFGEAAERSRLIVAGPPGGGPGRGMVALGEPAADAEAGYLAWYKNGTLSRELIRQAMLIAARDELGLATRDA